MDTKEIDYLKKKKKLLQATHFVQVCSKAKKPKMKLITSVIFSEKYAYSYSKGNSLS